MTYYTGFDSAWGGRAPGAMCDLQAVRTDELEFVAAPARLNWDEAVRRVSLWSNWNDHVVAIDQGLVVPNATRGRPVERQLASALMRRFCCGAHASNTSNERCYGPDAGIWKFTAALEGAGYRQNPMAVARGDSGRFFFECYPHPAFLGLFDLNRILRYKARSGDLVAWREAVRLVRSLGAMGRTPRLLGIERHVPPDWPQTKENEDILDSIICAYVGAHFHTNGTKSSLVIGSLDTGYMVTPVSSSTALALRTAFGVEINPEGEACSRRPVRGVPIASTLVPNSTNKSSGVKRSARMRGDGTAPYRPDAERIANAPNRASELLAELVLENEEEGVPRVLTYGQAWRVIFDDKAPHNLGSGYAEQVKPFIAAATGAFFSSLSADPVALDVFIVSSQTGEPGAGHFKGKPYTIEDWRRVFRDAKRGE